MNRSRRWYAYSLLLVLALSPSIVRGQDPSVKEKKADEKGAEKWLFDRALTVTATPAPVPNLKYRLYPATMERKPGNAVPIYLRFAHERGDARRKELREKPVEWNKMALKDMPLAEVKAFLDGYKYNLHQLELGARRKTADWNYTLDAGDPIGLVLPDAQEMRMHSPLLVLKARVETVEGRYADAVRTLETGFSFSQQINEGPFLINSLVGIAVASQMADCLLEVVERPEAPNLYWALTVLPRPLIDLRKGYEFELMVPELQFPDLADLKRARAPEDWDATLARHRREIERMLSFEKNAKPLKPGTASTDPAAKSPDLPAARTYLIEVVGLSKASVEAMHPAQVLLLHISHYHHEIRDSVFKSAYVDFPQSWAMSKNEKETLGALPDVEASFLPRYLLPAIRKVRLAQARIERKLAALRTIEALRMHAAENQGKLPDKLDQVTIVPVPNDPGTGKPFEYRLDGQTATLISRILGESLETTGLRYRVTIKK
jgi:hypothetical protein